MIRSGQRLSLSGAIYALQQQAKLSTHPGGRTALGMQGFAHYLEINTKETLLFAGRGVKLPAWFKDNRWDTLPVLITTSFLPEMTGQVSFEEKGHTIIISGAARAMMECIELATHGLIICK